MEVLCLNKSNTVNDDDNDDDDKGRSDCRMIIAS
jgi:hypothetical protein